MYKKLLYDKRDISDHQGEDTFHTLVVTSN